MDLVIAVVLGIGILVVALFVIAVMIAKFYRKVEQGKALIVNKMKAEPEVTFTGATVLPIIHKAEVMDISVKTIEIDRRAKDGLICRDNIRADIKVTFFVRVNKTVEDVIKVAQSIGCLRASDRETLEALFSAKFSEGLKTVGKQLDFVDLYTKRHEFRDAIINLIGRDLNGYVL
ncbi:MAG TPA: SPFH domain-containing protein, partial [Thermoanaerobaculia bacterium]|nr:SPFH domain-containing protein [Thermoanaerobaculia bacterium]